jgi:predicted metal-binding membrane protein
MWAARSDSRAFASVFVALVAGAWLSLAAWGASPAAYLLHHEAIGHVQLKPGGQYLVVLVAFLAGWVLMTVAMMLPTVLPLLTILRGAAGANHRGIATLAAAAGYLLAWSIFGAAAHALDLLIHSGVEAHAWLHANAWFLGAAPLLLAGVYQFTPLKHLCLDRCRSPFSFVAQRWHGSRPGLNALRVGVEHGVFCIGCCWALMLLMFALSIGNLAWMLGLAAVMGIEKNASWGHRLTEPLGVVMLSAGLTVVALNL